MIGEGSIGNNYEITGRYIIKLLSRHVPGGTQRKHEKFSQDNSVRAQNRTKYLPNTSLDVPAL
jgi:hypothetical protein